MKFEEMTPEKSRALFDAASEIDRLLDDTEAAGPLGPALARLRAAITPQVIATDAELGRLEAYAPNTDAAKRAIAADAYKRMSVQAIEAGHDAFGLRCQGYAAQALKGTP